MSLDELDIEGITTLLKQSLAENINIIENSLVCLLERLFAADINLKNEQEYIAISFLHTSIIDRYPLYRVELLDRSMFSESSDFLYMDITSIRDYIAVLSTREKNGKVSICKDCVCELTKMMHFMLEEDIVKTTHNYLSAKNIKNIKVLFGEYLFHYTEF